MTSSGSDKNWRERLDVLGRKFFELTALLDLRFLEVNALGDSEGQRLTREVEELERDLLETQRELLSVRSEIAATSDIERMISEIREARIARTRVLREMRRDERAIEQAQARALRQELTRRHPPYLGRRVSSQLNYADSDVARLSRLGLPIIDNVLELAEAADVEPHQVTWLAFDAEVISPEADHYRRFRIAKRSGGERSISSPRPKTRQVQLWIKQSILDRMSPEPAATAFRPGLSIVQNARCHLDAHVVVRIDVKDFFPSITFGRVRGWFAQQGYSPGMASVLALLVTDRDRRLVTVEGVTRSVSVGERGLPQGACTSPALANLIMRSFDRRVSAWAGSQGWTYTRYADDLIFSSVSGDLDVGRLLGFAGRALREEGLEVNSKKTAVMRRPARRIVTGLVLGDDGEVRLRRDYRRRLRAFLHRCESRGLSTVSEEDGCDALSVARGHIAFVRMVSPREASEIEQKHPWLAVG